MNILKLLCLCSLVLVALKRGLDDLCETVSELLQHPQLALHAAPGLALRLLSPGQQAAAHGLHHGRSDHRLRRSERTRGTGEPLPAATYKEVTAAAAEQVIRLL